jgi:hypothetical protein
VLKDKSKGTETAALETLEAVDVGDTVGVLALSPKLPTPTP